MSFLLKLKEKLSNIIKTIENYPVFFPFLISILALLVSIGSFLYSYMAQNPDDTPIRKLIEKEAELAKNHNVDEVVNLFTDDAVIRDFGDSINKTSDTSKTFQEWGGKEKIRERYEEIKKHAIFTYLYHKDINIEFQNHGTHASATSSTAGKMRWDNGSEYPISTKKGELWSFEKSNNEWKISYVDFHTKK